MRLNHPEMAPGDSFPECGCEWRLYQLEQPNVNERMIILSDLSRPLTVLLLHRQVRFFPGQRINKAAVSPQYLVCQHHHPPVRLGDWTECKDFLHCLLFSSGTKPASIQNQRRGRRTVEWVVHIQLPLGVTRAATVAPGVARRGLSLALSA